MNSKLLDLVLTQITKDMESGDVTALVELLCYVPEKVLVNFLSEDTLK
jgi:hypothetical protein